MQAKLQDIIEIIIDIVIAEKIFLLPAQPLARQDPIPQQLAEYHLLVLSREREKHDTKDLQRRIEIGCASIAVVNVMVIDVHFFNSRLNEQQYFFPELANSSILYDYGRVPLQPRPQPDIPVIQRSLRQSFRFWFSKAEALFDKAAALWLKGVMDLPALAESIRGIYTGAEIVFTGFDPQTHDLFRLRRSTARFSGEIALLFPFHSQKEKHLLTRLNKTSLGKSSKEKRPMSTLEYEAGLRRVQDLMMVALFVTQDYINRMGIIPES